MARWATCRDCGLLVSRRAVSCPKCGRAFRRPRGRIGCLGVLLMLVLGLGALAIWAPEPRRTATTGGPAASPPTTTRVGDRAELAPPGGGAATLAVDDAAWDELIDAQNAGSIELIDRLVQQGRVIREVAGNRVLVLKTSPFARYVRVERGLHNGAEGWIQAESLRPLSAGR